MDLDDLQDIEKNEDDNQDGLRTVRILQSEDGVNGRYWRSLSDKRDRVQEELGVSSYQRQTKTPRASFMFLASLPVLVTATAGLRQGDPRLCSLQKQCPWRSLCSNVVAFALTSLSRFGTTGASPHSLGIQ
ncbi:hypothetical protein U0070_027105 [Myodes glareolus]|uniref:Uncharacterized protein n=1 Tax=Myodes glareolus TaxID=447135 RepID=A0AAW0HAZ9_MYOGA